MERRYKILLVDDEPDILSTYTEYFEKRNFLVDTACDGVEGFEKLSQGEFDVAIIDILMPKITGIEMLRRARQAGFDTSMIILTGHGGEEEAIEAINIGVDAWFSKSSVKPSELLAKVTELAEGMPLDEIRQILSAIPIEDKSDD